MAKKRSSKNFKSKSAKVRGVNSSQKVSASAAMNETATPSFDKNLEKKNKISRLDKIRKVQPQHFRLSSLVLFVVITALFIAIQGMERGDALANTIHYGYISTVLLAFLIPMFGFFVVKRYR